MADVKCTPVIPDVPDLKSQELTVGRHFYLSCTGTWDKSFDFLRANLITDEQTKFLIKLFKVQVRDADKFDVDMTIYAAGKTQLPDLVLTDGSQQISLGPQQFEVVSVLPKPDPSNQEPPKPFGFAVGSLHWPMAYTLIFAVLILAVIIQALLLAARKKRWNHFLENVKSFETSQAADNQFYKRIRTIEKKEYPMNEVEQAAKIYILRRFQVPIFDLSLKESIKFMKKKYPQAKELRRQVFNIIKDLELLKTDSELTQEQKIKFVQRFYEFITRCEQQMGGLR